MGTGGKYHKREKIGDNSPAKKRVAVPCPDSCTLVWVEVFSCRAKGGPILITVGMFELALLGAARVLFVLGRRPRKGQHESVHTICTPSKKASGLKPAKPLFSWWAVRDSNPEPPD
jgi:hypothetical protein